MYLKSIELQGFKSFAMKTKFEFNNGITGIVGPNGSGKSNVADAVRWVLGEQRAKQLRGSSMQDVIFAGTENRKPLSYAYVAITLDNSDHALAVEYNEVTIARRIYRSGESEYLLNGTACRLKDVHEIFYDTGIGKEGYSIIGQGQIEQIISGKPEERRELFDEAAGIVKYKRRKAAAQKKLIGEEENLVRVNDIITELEKQVGPLERQAEKAKVFLKRKEELKNFDINLFLIQMDELDQKIEETEKKLGILSDDMTSKKEAYEKLKENSEEMKTSIDELEQKINSMREKQSSDAVTKVNLENQIELLKEQIKTAQASDEHLQDRMEALSKEIETKTKEKDEYDKRAKEVLAQIEEKEKIHKEKQEKAEALSAEIDGLNRLIEEGKAEVLDLLNKKAQVTARMQHFDTLMQQVNIQKAGASQKQITGKSELDVLENKLKEHEKEADEAFIALDEKNKEKDELLKKMDSLAKERDSVTEELEKINKNYIGKQSRLESLTNIAERYEGYGGSIRRIMEQKKNNPGICGVVADIIETPKEYETAIEIALGGNIQNIVTEDEQCAKDLIEFLKKNKFGRATFLPITSVGPRDRGREHDALGENGVIGMADSLVKTDDKYKGVAAYLLGRILVVESLDSALKLAKKYNYRIRMVTLEGELIQPGGSLTGGTFKNSANLLGRKREMEELEKEIKDLSKARLSCIEKQDKIRASRADVRKKIGESEDEIKEREIALNTAKLNKKRAEEEYDAAKESMEMLVSEVTSLEAKINEIEAEKKRVNDEAESSKAREKEIEEQNEERAKIIEEKSVLLDDAKSEAESSALEESKVRQNITFINENLDRINREIEKTDIELRRIKSDSGKSVGEIEQKTKNIEKLKETIASADEMAGKADIELKESIKKKDEMSENYRKFFEDREEMTREIANLEREADRLTSQLDGAKSQKDSQTSYMWNEYELTYHNALNMRVETEHSPAELKKKVKEIRDSIKALGNVNVAAIEDYREVSERYEFLTTQRNDITDAKNNLLGIIDELDKGMRKQFNTEFARIQEEFTRVFKILFGGGKGSLELVEGEDILEAGIEIIAQPPGKKLQNMMQLSGGEKSLTAISLLFAIQNLKPSPFCLLDEIEAALDEPNVNRFANYLHKLTKYTQFIVITHRRGTMDAADRLYGITMQEKGVSAQVSVNLVEEEMEEDGVLG
ncbi:MAG: chromosome segregation protein SMC [Eubacterium sp.]|nr:chromosome segregation protein SMC [Eubacterium sp.]